MSSQYSALVDKIRSKYPHQYDDLSDDELGKKWITKYPQYQDLVKPIEPVPIPKVQTTGEADKSRFMEATGGEKPLATPVLPFGAAFTSAPKMIAGVVGGMGGTEAGTQLGKFMNLSPEHTRWVSDVLGFLTSAVATHGEGKLEPHLKGTTLEAPEGVKLPLGFRLKRPPAMEPPPSPEEVEYQKAKTITEAQEAAAAEKTKREAAATRESTRAAKAKEAGFNKEAQDRMAIQKRADDAEAARVKAEKDAKNARFKADQEHEKELAAAEKARQDEITAQAKLKQVQEQMKAAEEAKEQGRLKLLQQQEKQAIRDANEAAAQKERLRNQHADALMRRGREQAALDKAAEDAGAEEDTAKAEVRKAPAQKGSGPRPTASEQYLTGLVKKNILSPDEFNTLRSELGDDAVPKRGESNAAWRARVMGLIRSSRAARGMADISSGPSQSAPVAYRARPVGENGIPKSARPQATTDPAQATQYAKDLTKMTGKPHEVATIDLSKTPHTKVPHPSGATWVQFEDATPESAVTKKSKPTDPADFEF